VGGRFFFAYQGGSDSPLCPPVSYATNDNSQKVEQLYNSKILKCRGISPTSEISATVARSRVQNGSEKVDNTSSASYTHGKVAQGLSRKRWRDYISDLVWSRFDV